MVFLDAFKVVVVGTLACGGLCGDEVLFIDDVLIEVCDILCELVLLGDKDVGDEFLSCGNINVGFVDKVAKFSFFVIVLGCALIIFNIGLV